MTWHTVYPIEFGDILRSPDGDVVPEDAGVYCWRLSFDYPPHLGRTAPEVRRWIHDLCGRATLSTDHVRVQSSLAISARVGGVPLTKQKSDHLAALVKSPRGRQLMLEFATSLQEMSPVLYIGKAKNLSQRIRQHLSQVTDFTITLKRKGLCSIEDLVLQYCSIGIKYSSSVEPTLTLLEMTAQRCIHPSAVEREG